MNRKAFYLLIISGISISFGAMALLWGPYGCSACNVSSPVADSATINMLDRVPADPGDVIQMCNSSDCTKYEVTANGGYSGQGKVKRDPPGEPVPPEPPVILGGGTGGGGGGGGDGGSNGGYAGGGSNPGGGCYGNCGTVIVSPPITVKPTDIGSGSQS